MKNLIVLLIIFLVLSCTKVEENLLKKKYNLDYLNKLLVIAKFSIINQINNSQINKFTDLNYTNSNTGVFVRLLKNNKERGCIGFLKGVNNIEYSVSAAAINAAFFDTRFPKINSNEFDKLEIEITIIDKLKKINDPFDFIIGRHSLLIDNKVYRGFLQAQIALEKKYKKKYFLKALCKKAKLPENHYLNKNTSIYKADTIYLRKKFNDIQNNLKYFSLPHKMLNKQYALLSCKVDSLYYALQFYVDDLINIKWFINQIPITKDNYLKYISDNRYEISDPYNSTIGGLYSQLPRFSNHNRLLIETSGKYFPAQFREDKYLDCSYILEKYNKTIGFGIDTKLLLKTFNNYFLDKKIIINKFFDKNMNEEKMIELFINELLINRVIFCNGIVKDFNNARVFQFKIIGKNINYKWKEATHSLVITGYNLNKKTFICADNYGSLNTPYTPAFYDISFEKLYKDITMLDVATLDYSFSIGKAN